MRLHYSSWLSGSNKGHSVIRVVKGSVVYSSNQIGTHYRSIPFSRSRVTAVGGHPTEGKG